MTKKKLVVLSGAGISQESGIRTFRETGGLWEEYDIMDVCSPEGWAKNPQLVQDFYNARRKQLLDCKPNTAHTDLAKLESDFDVHIITQNVDNLHERAGSTKVLHLHGELTKVRSQKDKNIIFELDGWELKMGDLCEKGSQLRPHIVWFGEDVPEIENAIPIVASADVVVVIGTSLNVYPAAALMHYAEKGTPVYLIDPNPVKCDAHVQVIAEKASVGMQMLIRKLKK